MPLPTTANGRQLGYTKILSVGRCLSGCCSQSHINRQELYKISHIQGVDLMRIMREAEFRKLCELCFKAIFSVISFEFVRSRSPAPLTILNMHHFSDD